MNHLAALTGLTTAAKLHARPETDTLNTPHSKARTAPRREPLFALAWHLAWAAAIAVTVATLLLVPAARPMLLPLGLVGGAALAGAALSLTASSTARATAISLWGVAAVCACLLTGGAAGPLAPWCLAPLAAALAFRRPGLMPLGVAASVIAAGVVATASLLLRPVSPAPDVAMWLGLLVLMTTTLGLGAGLVHLQGRQRGELGRRDAADLALREALGHQPQLFLNLRPDGCVLAALGRPPAGLSDPTNTLLQDLAGVDDVARITEALARALAEGEAAVGFAPLHDRQGWCELALRRVGPGRLAGALRDARTQHARERALEIAAKTAEEQNAGKSRFLANMSHELRTPLNAIMGFSDIMKQRLFGPLSDRYLDYAELIHESGQHLLELINDVLDMSKIEAERFELAREDFDARDAVSATLRLMRGQADRAGVSLRGVLPAGPLDAEADRRAIKQIALNLISNALKFTPRGGSVTVTLQGDGEMLELIVADTGAGIGADDLARLGKPYEQAGDNSQKAQGTGLGLSLVRAFARLHGGEMVLESELGEGTTAIVRLPVLIPPAPATRVAVG